MAADYDDMLPEDIRTGTTGLACMDAFSPRKLRQTGYLHNHARMWLAAYIVHWRGVRWQAGARWFLSHLLDGDPASNNLSWQWVASTFSHKPYLFNRENLERFTHGVYCEQCPLRGRCELDAGYETLAERLFAPGREPDPTSQSEARQAAASVEASDWSTTEYDNDELDGGVDGVIWIHGDCLDPHSAALRGTADTPAIWVWDEQLLATQQISLKRIVFLNECLLELPVTICRGDVAREVLRFAGSAAGDVVTMGSVSPGFQQIRGQIAAQMPVVTYNKEPFVVIDDTVDLRRFSRTGSRSSTQRLPRGEANGSRWQNESGGHPRHLRLPRRKGSMFVRLLLGVAAIGLVALVWRIAVRQSRLSVTSEAIHFPSVSGSNLNRQELSFPADFAGDLNLLFVPFLQQHQVIVNTWLPFAEALEAANPQLV